MTAALETFRGGNRRDEIDVEEVTERLVRLYGEEFFDDSFHIIQILAACDFPVRICVTHHDEVYATSF